MKTKIYLIRHAEAEGNFRRTFQGHTDSAVSEKGLHQLDFLAERFRGIQFDAVYSSPLRRAVQTAQAANRFLGRQLSTDAGLLEINGGEYEGVPFAELPIRFPCQDECWVKHPEDFEAPSGETMRQVFIRMRDTINNIAHANAGGTVVIASHGCAIRNYICYANGHDINYLRYTQWCDNTAVNLIEYDDTFTPHIVFLNDSSHLPEEFSTFSTQSWWKNIPKPEDELLCKPEKETIL